MSKGSGQLDFFDPVAEVSPPERHRVLHISEVRLRPHQLQIWPPCVAQWSETERAVHFGDLPQRPKLFVWEVGDFFHVCKDTVYRWLDDGTLDAINVGRKDLTRPDLRILRYSVVELYVTRREGANDITDMVGRG